MSLDLEMNSHARNTNSVSSYLQNSESRCQSNGRLIRLHFYITSHSSSKSTLQLVFQHIVLNAGVLFALSLGAWSVSPFVHFLVVRSITSSSFR